MLSIREFRGHSRILPAVLVALIAVAGGTVSAQDDRGITSLRDLNQAFIQIAKDVTPSVVTVSTERVTRMRNQMPFNFPFSMDPFGQFFGAPRGSQQMPEQEFRQQGLGSGVIVSNDGYILTNNHVVANADSITVRFSDGRSMGAKVVGADPKSDIAVIQVNASGLTPIRRGDSDGLQVGEIVLAVGSPLNPNLAHSVSQGIVSAKGRSNVGLADYEDFIQTDAAINPGNSGGALVNLDGELIGINTAIASRSGGFQGIGFAVPVNMALDVMNSLIADGRVVRGWLGVSIQDINDAMARAMGLRDGNGVLIGSVSPDGPAASAGIEPGDVIVRVDSREVENSAQLRNLIARSDPGTTVTLGVNRDNSNRDIRVKLGELPDEEGTDRGDHNERRRPQSRGVDPGFDVSSITRELARRFDIPADIDGVVITDIDQSSPAFYDGNLRAGDVIREVNRQPIASVEQFDSALRGMRTGDPLMLLVSRGEQTFFVAFDLR